MIVFRDFNELIETVEKLNTELDQTIARNREHGKERTHAHQFALGERAGVRQVLHYLRDFGETSGLRKDGKKKKG